jgi:DNA-binding FadR family transcriptional regulator
VGRVSAAHPTAVDAVFDPLRSPSTFESTVERLGTAVRIGVLPPGRRLPPERELADQLGISRSTLRQAILTLTQSGHLTSARGRGGGTFVAASPPLVSAAPVDVVDRRRDLLDFRVAVETGVVVLACERAAPEAFDRLAGPVAAMAGSLEDFAAYRRADVAFHLGLAELADSPRLLAAMTEVQGAMSELIARIAHPPAVLERSNAQHARLLALLRRGDGARAVRLVREHLEGTELILTGLLP